MRKQRFSDEQLFTVRNNIPLQWLIEVVLKRPCKEVEGIFWFLCPCCGELRCAINARINLARCFLCQKNFNTIDLTMAECKSGFIEAVDFLEQHLVTNSRPNFLIKPGSHKTNKLVSLNEILRDVISLEGKQK